MSELPPSVVRGAAPREGEAVGAAAALARQVAQWHEAGRWHGQVGVATVTFDASHGPRLSEPQSIFRLGDSAGDWERLPPSLHDRLPLELPSDLALARRRLIAAGVGLDPVQIDLHSLAVLLCRWITGESASAFLRSPKVKRLVPEPLQPILERALGSQAENRFGDVTEFAGALQEAAAQQPTERLTANPPERRSTGDTTPSRLSALSDNDTSIIGPGAGDDSSSPAAAGPDEGAGSGPSPELPFTKLGHYEIRQRIGHGGMGDVYLGYERPLDRHVAIKVLPAELARDAEFVRRFRVEATAVARLNHPNIVPIYYIGEDQGHHFYAMQFIEGESLADLLARRGTLPVDEALPIVEQTLAGLALAHEHGMVHRDIKPGNILLDQKSRRALLADFGLVKSLSSSVTGKTATGVVMGTVDYISPEQGRGLAVDARSDLYSIGVLLFRMLSGKLPFTADSPTALIFQHVYEPPPSLREINPDIPPSLVTVVERLLAKAPEERYQSAAELQADLRAIESGLPIPPATSRTSAIPDRSASRLTLPSESPRKTALITAPEFEPDPVLPENVLIALPRWPERVRDKALSLFRRHAPEAVRKLQSTEHQIDAALAVYQRRQRELARLVQEAESVVAELEHIAGSHEEAARASRQRAESESNAAARHEADAAELANLQDAKLLRGQAAEQAQHLDSIRLNLARVTASLEQVRNQRDLLNAQLKLVAPRQTETGKVPRWKAVLTICAALIASGSLFNLAAQLRVRWNAASPANPDDRSGRQAGSSTERAQTAKSGGSGQSDSTGIAPTGLIIVETAGHQADRIVVSDSGGSLSVYRIDKQGQLRSGPNISLRSGAATSLAADPKTGWVAAGGSSGSIAIWDLDEGRQVRELRGHVGAVGALAFSPEGNRLLSSGGDGTLRIWDIQAETELTRLPPHQFHGAGTNLSWHVSENRALLAMKLHGAESCRIVDLSTGDDITLMQGRTGCTAASLSPDGNIACGFTENSIVVWNAATGAVIRRFGRGTQIAAFSPDARRVITIGDRRLSADRPSPVLISLWDVSKGVVMQEWEGERGQPEVAAFSPDGHRAALAYGDGHVQLLELGNSNVATRLLGKVMVGSPVRSLAISPDGFSAACGDEKGAHLWRIADPDLRRTFELAAPVSTLEFSAAADRVLLATATPQSRSNFAALRKYSATSAEFLFEGNRDLRRFGTGSGAFIAAKFTPDRRSVVTADADGLIRVWEIQTERLLQTLQCPVPVSGLALSRQENRVLIAGQDNALRLWDCVTGHEPLLWPGHSFHVRCVDFAEQRSVAASAAGDRTIRIWDPRSGETIKVLKVTGGSVNCVDLAGDGSALLAGDEDGQVTWWDTATGKPRFQFAAHSSAVRAVALFPSEQEALSAGDDGNVCRWDLRPVVK